MNAKDLETLKANVDRMVKITSCDGESLVAKVVLVSEEDEDVGLKQTLTGSARKAQSVALSMKHSSV